MRREIGSILLGLALVRCPAPPVVEPRPYSDDAGLPGAGGTTEATPPPDAAPPIEPVDAAPPPPPVDAAVAELPKPDASSCAPRAIGQSYGPARCFSNADCNLVTLECCPPCGPMRRDSVRAVAVGQLMPPCSLACPACVALPPPDLGVACIAGHCQLMQDPCAQPTSPSLLDQGRF